MKKMLVNARQPEEVRIATVENGKLHNIDIESVDYEQKKANIYKGIVTRVEPSLNAAFINYGEKKNGFLPFKEIAPENFKRQVKDGQDIPLTELLDVGQEIIVQINKEERGTKGAALSTYITLAGCYLVLMPNNAEAGGISRRIEGDERQKLKDLFNALRIPREMGVIIRTAGVDRQVEEMQWDLDVLLKLWDAIKEAADQQKAPFLIHSESDIIVRSIRDHLKDDVEEITVDSKEAFDSLKRQLIMLRPDFVERIKLYDEKVPLFTKEQIESKIEEAYKREVVLTSGGSIVIDTTEALTAIDINSARATRGGDIEETAYLTNLEAADEIARQLRLRDIGGLIIVDFIDMQDSENQRKVEHALIDALANDRAKVQMTRISRFGLVEISRQRLQSSLGESATISCPRCEGQGIIRSVPSLALSILRLIEEEAHKEKTNEIRVQLPISVATYLLNEKRDAVNEVEQELGFKLVLIPNPNLETPHFNIQRIWGDNYVANKSSYNLIEERKEDFESYIKPNKSKPQQPAVKSVSVEKAPMAKLQKKESLFKKIWNGLFGVSEAQVKPQVKQQPHQKSQQANKQQDQKRRPHQNRQQQDQKNYDQRDRRKSAQHGGHNKGRNDNRGNRQQGQNQRYQNNKNNPRQNLYKNDEVIDVKLAVAQEPKVKNNVQQQQKTQPKAASKQTVIKSAESMVSSLNVKPLALNTKSRLIADPQSRISDMVKQTLELSVTQSTIQQVETKEETQKVKYLKFEIVDLLALKREKERKEKEARRAKEEARKAKEAYEKAKKEEEARKKAEEEAKKAQALKEAEIKASEVSQEQVSAVSVEDKAPQAEIENQQTSTKDEVSVSEMKNQNQPQASVQAQAIEEVVIKPEVMDKEMFNNFESEVEVVIVDDRDYDVQFEVEAEIEVEGEKSAEASKPAEPVKKEDSVVETKPVESFNEKEIFELTETKPEAVISSTDDKPKVIEKEEAEIIVVEPVSEISKEEVSEKQITQVDEKAHLEKKSEVEKQQNQQSQETEAVIKNENKEDAEEVAKKRKPHYRANRAMQQRQNRNAGVNQHKKKHFDAEKNQQTNHEGKQDQSQASRKPQVQSEKQSNTEKEES